MDLDALDRAVFSLRDFHVDDRRARQYAKSVFDSLQSGDAIGRGLYVLKGPPRGLPPQPTRVQPQ